jgi:catechol 2,3-dioxygenase-like lactoylglutathione lyase family enzyme
MPALRFTHLNLPARDPAAQARWYAETFGFANGGTFVHAPGFLLVFEPGEPLGRRGNTHFGFAAPTREAVDTWATTLAAKADHEPRSASLKAEDPEGNLFEIYWEPDGPAIG